MQTVTALRFTLLLPILSACGQAFSDTDTSALADTRAATHSTVLVLSGGGSPASNHHSQYLQTRALAEGMQARLGGDKVDVYFAAGNRPDVQATLADVHKSEKQNGLDVDVMVVGAIEKNNKASKENVKAYLGSARPASNDKFFMLVSDHGMPNQMAQSYEDNCMDLWAFDEATRSDSDFSRHCLSRAEVEKLLPRNKTTVFAMSQCFSGGFHMMSVKTNTQSGSITVNPRVCGFTAAPPDLTASGCTPNADGPGYKGYERYFTQQMIGKNFVTGAALPDGPRATVREAHLAAALEDLTGDVPMSTSDYYLSQWAELIRQGDARLSTDTVTTSELQSALEKNSTVAPTTAAQVDLRTLSREGYVEQMIARIVKDLPITKDYAYSLSLDQIDTEVAKLEQAEGQIEQEMNSVGREMSLLKRDLFLPEWSARIESNPPASLTSEELEWERTTYLPEEEQNLWLNTGAHLKQDLSFLFVSDPAQALRKSTYLARREALFMDTMSESASPRLQAGLKRMKELNKKSDELNARYEETEAKFRYARRISFLRQVVGAERTLKQVRAQSELTNLQQLESCEATTF